MKRGFFVRWGYQAIGRWYHKVLPNSTTAF